MEEKLNEKLTFVFSYLMKMGASKEDAEDIIQDTAYKFLLYLDSMEINNLESWLFRVAINQYYDMCRKRSRRNNIMLKFNFQKLFEEDTPEQAYIQLEFTKDIHELLGKLNPKYSEMLVLKYSAGLKVTEIAALYKMKEGSVKTILHRARQQFIVEYRRYESEQEGRISHQRY